MAPQGSTGAGAEAELPEYAGHYHLESCLGSGGMGVVHLARSTSGLKLAVKVVHARFARDPEFRGRFRQEIAAARRVSGAFTAPVVDADPDAERPWMATLFIPGPTLAEHVKRNGAMPTAQLRRLMAGLAEALRDIHRVGVVHRDLKPSNVLLAKDGPKVIDFGISRPKDSELRTETGKLIGTPPFMAPEQFRRPREVGPAADVFALGSVLVHAATGRGPFDSDSPYLVAYQVVHDEPDLTGVPEPLAPLVRRCLAKEPEERPTPDELMRELRSVAASYDTQAFIPAQRTTDADADADAGEGGGDGDREGHRDGEGDGDREGGRAGDGDGSGGDEAVSGRRRWARRRVGLAAVAVVLALGAGVVAVQSGGSAERPTGRAKSGSTPGSSAGFEAWQVTAPGSGMPQCSYGGAQLVCGQAGVVFALDPADGTSLWRHPVADTARSAPPTFSGGLVQPLTEATSRLEALNPRDGTVRWHHDRPSDSALRTVAGMLLLTGADGRVTGVDSATGDQKWQHRIPGQTTPYLRSFAGDPSVYAVSVDGTHTRVAAVNPVTGKVSWEARLAGSLTPVGVHDGSVTFLANDLSDVTQAVVHYDPGARKARRTALPVGLNGAVATVRGSVVYLMAVGGTLEAVDTETGTSLWQLETSLSRGSAPAVDARHVYVSAADGRLIAVDARKGTFVGQTGPRPSGRSNQVPGVLPTPVLSGSAVYGAAPDGTVFAVDARQPAHW
ncbi:PQQ-binding-like beta-propeller repeat protein [Streptomyces sp. NPDC087212]|uniref:protein kinase domain-containing protein n=1 Tax=Streptomyces sp. NPDC087212 TaxID=3365766 RepID=UPI0038107C45